ncbi:alpha/beta-hydrolase [Ascodesmis nigricans]|uniref:Alpha/beta-hydrolase n=1 Tax=Ascodesmis nigricans TaxID=341454 RepID=A0A4S2MMR5_9PEZI|nr:alpha/beta-hydrolase [Ascodesmis nigricans]
MKLSTLLPLPLLGASPRFTHASALPPHSLVSSEPTPHNATVSQRLFDELEELARIVDIAYCVGTMNSGITNPFQCLSFCKDFPDFELIQTWNTGLTLSDSCGYIALDHSPTHPRIIIAFRGTYSLTNALIDLSAGQQEYLPYPSDGHSLPVADKCSGCVVHQGFLESWSQTEKLISPVIEELRRTQPGYRVTLVGHSLGGAVAALAGLDFGAREWKPRVVTFGEPKVGNYELAEYFNKKFPPSSQSYHRVTHLNDPIPQLPLTAMGYTHHAHELYVTKPQLPFTADDIRVCVGNEDPECVAGNVWSLWKSLYGHRDYFHRMGLCLPPASWFRKWDDAETVVGELRRRRRV